MIDLTARQVQILRALIEEFITTAEPVGSETIDKKFAIGVSPATIRNEMVYLTNQGYLTKTHSSAGRIPTPAAMKLYVNELMKEKDLSVADEVSAKEKIWNSRSQTDKMFHQITKVLADKSNALAITLVEDDQLYHSGYANLLQMPEFYDIKVMRHVLQLIEEETLLGEIFRSSTSENLIQVIYGPELGNKDLNGIGIIHMTFEVDGQIIHVGVLGSSRFDYPYIIPMMKYMRNLINEIVE
ncbi:DeoR family transcriptional regulator [Candidatus Woesebacteria bacterium]|nr:DeoR family transcriptional regulator [Candidatus Woesebacteria bacterium]